MPQILYSCSGLVDTITVIVGCSIQQSILDRSCPLGDPALLLPATNRSRSLRFGLSFFFVIFRPDIDPPQTPRDHKAYDRQGNGHIEHSIDALRVR